jgi:hypothetical protein
MTGDIKDLLALVRRVPRRTQREITAMGWRRLPAHMGTMRCENCGEVMDAWRSDKRTCSVRCRKQLQRMRAEKIKEETAAEMTEILKDRDAKEVA